MVGSVYAENKEYSPRYFFVEANESVSERLFSRVVSSEHAVTFMYK